MSDVNALEGRVAVVAGGAGGVGEGIVEGFLDAGATVIVPSRSADRLAALSARLPSPRLVKLETDIGVVDQAEQLRDHVLREYGRLDTVVACVGGWWQGEPLVEVDLGTWQRVLTANLTTHFVLARTFVPVLASRPGTSYQMVCGDADVNPIAGAALPSVTAAGVMALFRSLVLEQIGASVRINVLYLGPVTTRKHAGGSDRITAAEVGAHAAYLASDAGAMVAGSVVQLARRPASARSGSNQRHGG